MAALLAHGGAVLAVQRDVKDAAAQLLGHFPLQLQALPHPRLDWPLKWSHTGKALDGSGLGVQQDVSGVGGKGHAVNRIQGDARIRKKKNGPAAGRFSNRYSMSLQLLKK